MHRRLLAILLVVVLTLGATGQALANASSTPKYKVGTEAEEAAFHRAYIEQKLHQPPVAEPVGRKTDISPMYVDPGDGAVDIRESWASSGTTVLDSDKSGIASAMWNISMNILSYFLTIFGNIVKDVALAGYGLLESSIDKNQGTTARLFHSYLYRSHDAYVYTAATRTWGLYVVSENREWYRHEFSSFVGTDGYTRTKTIDYTANNGYSPIHTDVAPHYSDYTWLRDTATYRWRMGYGTYYEYGW